MKLEHPATQITECRHVMSIHLLHYLPEVPTVLHQVRPVLEQPAADQENEVAAVSLHHLGHAVKAHTTARRRKDGLEMPHGFHGPPDDVSAFLPAEGEA